MTDEPIEGLPAGLGLETTTELRQTLREHAGAWKQTASFRAPSILALVDDVDRLAAEVARLTSVLALASERERETCEQAIWAIPNLPVATRERIVAAIRARDNPYEAADIFEEWVAEAHEKKGVRP
jgi:hypothetical protein